jgi:hypothetical protein
MLLGSIVSAVLLSAAVGPTTTGDLEVRLEEQGLLKERDRRDLAKGAIVTRILETADKSEIRTLTVLRVNASEAQFLRCVRDPSCLKRAGEMVAAGPLTTSPAAGEFQSVTLDSKELGYLSKCRVGLCDVRLPAEDIRRFHDEVDWKTAGSRPKAEAMFRDLLVRFARSYRTGGDEVLPTYSNNPHPIQVGASLHGLLATNLPVLDQVPALVQRLERFPEITDASGDDFLYWYKERVWRESVIALNHVVVHEETEGAAKAVFVVSKQLFASNYYDSAIEVTELYSPAGGGPATLAFLSAARMDVGRPEGFNFVERLLIHHFIPRGLQHWFEGLRTRLQDASPAAPDRKAAQ